MSLVFSFGSNAYSMMLHSLDKTRSGITSGTVPMAVIHECQRQYGAILGTFLDLVASEQHWGDLAGELVLDVGCGNPQINLADLLVERYPKLQRVIAIDKIADLIKNKKPQRQIVHIVANIERRDDFLYFKDNVNKVLSRHCLHLVDQAAAFSNVHYILRPGGQAAFLFCLWSGYAAWFTDIAKNVKWNKYFKMKWSIGSPVTKYSKNLDAQYYTRLLEKVGFEVEYCKNEKDIYTYASDKKCKDMLMALNQNKFSVPPELKDEFKACLFDTFIEHNERDELGRPSQVSYHLTAMVRKPFCSVDSKVS